MEVKIFLLLLTGFILCATGEGLASQKFILAENRNCLASVVIPPGASELVRSAATDLATYVEKVSGVLPRVCQEGESTEGCAIHIGKTRAVENMHLPFVNLSEEGYIICPRENIIAICGRTDYGTVNGVYGFLRDCVGVRWFMPGELWEFVPRKNPLVVEVKETVSNPDFSFRIWSGVVSREGQEWYRRNRLTCYRNDIPFYGFGHNLGNIFPPSKYGKEHPEYYSEINGSRFVPPSDGVVLGQPCFTNPEVIRLTVEAAREYFDKNPKATQFSLCINDNAQCCTCLNCSRLDSPYQMHRTGKQYSDSYYYFVEQVAKEIARSHPGKTLGCYAYWPVELPPRHIKRLPDNVVICLTQDTSQHFDPEYRKADRDLYIKWSKVAAHMVKYDYYGLGWFTPRYFPHLAADDIKWLKEHGVVGQYCEVYPYWVMTAPQLYMAAQLLWDADQDAEALLEEFFDGLYADVAPEMKEFYATLERIWMKKRPGQWFQGLDRIDTELVNFDATAMTQAMSLLDRAYSESSGLVRERVDYVRRMFRFSYVVVIGYDAAMSLKSLPLENQSDANLLVSEMKRVLRLARDAEQVYSNTLKKDPLHQHAYYKDDDRFWQKFDGWQKRLVSQVIGQLTRLRTWAESNMPRPQAENFLNQVVEELSRIEIRQKANFQEVVNPALNVKRTAKGVVVDGNLDDWTEVEWTPIQDSQGNTVAEFALAWDVNNLYLAAKVYDAVHLQDRDAPYIWQQDSLQIGLDPLRDAWKTMGQMSYGSDDLEYGFALSDKGPIAWCWHGGTVDEVSFQVVRSEGTTIYEVALPWTSLKPAGGEIIGLAILVNNDDGFGRSYACWGGGIAEYKDPIQFKPVRLLN
jgi:hypothetical protein